MIALAMPPRRATTISTTDSFRARRQRARSSSGSQKHGPEGERPAHDIDESCREEQTMPNPATAEKNSPNRDESHTRCSGIAITSAPGSLGWSGRLECPVGE